MCNQSWKQLILNEISNKKWGYGTHLANLTGYTKSGNLLKVLRDPKREFEDFVTPLVIVQDLFPKQEFEIMTLYIKGLDINKQIARDALEYAAVNKLTDLKRYLINKMEESNNSDSVEWAKIYKLDDDSSTGIKTPSEGNNEIHKIYNHLKTDEMKVFANIVMFYNYYDLKYVGSMRDVAKLVEEELIKIENNYIKTSYESRYNLLMVDTYLHRNDLKTSRGFARNVLLNNNSFLLEAIAHLQLGNSYMMESFDKANSHFEKALSRLSESNYTGRQVADIKRSSNFNHNLWSKTPKYLDLTSGNSSDIHEVAFHLIQSGKKDQGIALLDSMDFETLTVYSKGFHMYYRGLATKEKHYFGKSIEYFNETEEKFYRMLPLMELEKLGVEKYLLSALSS